MKSFGRFIVVAIVALWAVAPVRAADQHVKISYVVPTVMYGDLLLGLDKGYFKEEGIDLELVAAGGGAATPALIAGDVQFSGSPAAAISAILKGAKLKVLYITSSNAAFQLWARNDIKSLADLKDKPVGVISRGDTTEIAMRYYLAKQGLSGDYVSYAPLGNGTARMAAITSGAYPASLLDALETAAFEADGKMNGYHIIADLHKDVRMTFSGIATSDALIKANPDLVLRVIRAAIKGIAYSKAYRDRAIASVMKHGTADRKNAEADYAAFAPELSLTGTMPADGQQMELELRGQMLGLAKDKIAKPSDVFDFSFAEKAATQLKSENWSPTQ
ncbi:MAG TPA: ABC transporter substrate-binding protein [Stellaceae bacterium]|jgi:ABC-type nitrate/sulfonate/bicarbonate transport system substrate-binding protein|nr:ABC transporter substrate-binding protein [Stellaceae bacterium]